VYGNYPRNKPHIASKTTRITTSIRSSERHLVPTKESLDMDTGKNVGNTPTPSTVILKYHPKFSQKPLTLQNLKEDMETPETKRHSSQVPQEGLETTEDIHFLSQKTRNSPDSSTM
jgi:hypothetical protein